MTRSAARHMATSRHTMITSLALAVLLAAGATSAALLLNVHTSPASARDYALASDCPPRKTPQAPYIGVALSKSFTTSLSQFSAATKITPNIVEKYVKFSKLDSVFKTRLMCRLTEDGALPLIQINPRSVKLAAIVHKKYNGELRVFASAVSRFHSKVAISFGHEMNGSWYSWGKPNPKYKHHRNTPPSIFKKAWRHIHNVFTEVGATNVIWVWTIDRARPRTGPKAVGPARWWWPGKKYVNWVGIDGYFRNPSNSFKHLFAAQLASVRSFTSDPVLITETAVPDNWRAVSQIRKIRELFRGVSAPGMLGFVWFDIDTKKDPWYIDNDRVASETFHTDADEYRDEYR
jgi:mannan endo-1,4-beta-mannosidase